MSLANRVSHLESGIATCPRCGRVEPIRIVEVLVPGPPLQDVLKHGTPAELAALDELLAPIYQRAGFANQGLAFS